MTFPGAGTSTYTEQDGEDEKRFSERQPLPRLATATSRGGRFHHGRLADRDGLMSREGGDRAVGEKLLPGLEKRIQSSRYRVRPRRLITAGSLRHLSGSNPRETQMERLPSVVGKGLTAASMDVPDTASPQAETASLQPQSGQEEAGRKQSSVQPLEMNLGNVCRPRGIMLRYGTKLSDQEKSEINNFQQIYYFGQKAKARSESPDVVCHCTCEKGPTFTVYKGEHISFRHEVKTLLGKGTYGWVVKCFDHKEKREVAVKICRRERSFREAAQDEIKILDFLRKQNRHRPTNSVRMFDNFVFRKHICLVFELLGPSLGDTLEANGVIRSPRLFRQIVLDIVICLEALSQYEIIHCDLKPENILWKKSGDGVKVADFGSSCFSKEKSQTYLQSRYYRSPEVLMGGSYNVAIDMWSLGCIVGELRVGEPLFQGDDSRDQMASYMEVLGVPEKSAQRGNTVRCHFTPEGHPRYADRYLSDGVMRYGGGVVSTCGIHRVAPGSRSLGEVLGGKEDAAAIDFIQRCLHWDPYKRLSPQQAKSHRFLSELASQQAHQHKPGAMLSRGFISRPSIAGQRPSIAGHRPSIVGHRPSITAHRPSIAGQRPLFAGQRPSIAGHRPSIIGQRNMVGGHRPSIARQRVMCKGDEGTRFELPHIS